MKEITYEEAKILINKIINDDPTYDQVASPDMCMGFLLGYKAHVCEMEQEGWISVKDRLPEKKGYYLVVVTDDVASKLRGNIEISDCYETVRDNKVVLKFQDYVTHYMPLPTPPKEQMSI